MTLEEIYLPISAPMQAIPATISDILRTPNPLAREIIEYFFSNQGKLLRPALTLLGAGVVNPGFYESGKPRDDLGKLLRLAASYEIFHAATLIHDDIIDSAHLRRNLPTINIKWGPQPAVLIGDYLHDRAINTIFSDGHEKILSRFLETARMVCDGEIREMQSKYNMKLSEEEYFDIIGRKTASLLSCCVEAGAIFAGGNAGEVTAVRNFGQFFGLAFQIVDDCLDFTGEEHEFGKTLGADCAAGIVTLPLIRLMQILDETAKRKILEIFKAGMGQVEFQDIRNQILANDAIAYALKKAREFIEKARLELRILSDSPAKQSLDKLLDYVLERNR